MTNDPSTTTVITHSWAWEDHTSTADGRPPMSWEDGREAFTGAGTYWLATIMPDGRPHVVPLLGVVVDGAPHVCANPHSRKVRNLEADPRCTLTAGGGAVDMAVDGVAARVAKASDLERVADAYGTKYGWRPEVRDAALWADGAPTAGPPPYHVYRIGPERAVALPTDEATTPTRWSFG